MRRLMAFILLTFVVSSCATMQRNKENYIEFRKLMTDKTITLPDMYRFGRGTCESLTSVLVDGRQVNVARWKLEMYPVSNTDSYLTFVDGKLSEIVIVKRLNYLHYTRRHR